METRDMETGQEWIIIWDTGMRHRNGTGTDTWDRNGKTMDTWDTCTGQEQKHGICGRDRNRNMGWEL